MRSVLRTLLATLAVMCVLPANRAAALEVFGNITASGGSAQVTNSGNPIGTGGVQFNKFAQGFTVGTTNQTMTDVILGLQFGTQLPSSVRISLYDNSGSNPGSELGVFTNPTFTANTKDIYTFNYSGNYTLVANTSYWVVASFDAPLTGSYDWVYNTANTAPAAQNSSGFIGLGSRATFNAAPTTWDNTFNDSPWNRASITVVVVPEPSTYALAAVGTLALGSIGRRKSRKTATV